MKCRWVEPVTVRWWTAQLLLLRENCSRVSRESQKAGLWWTAESFGLTLILNTHIEGWKNSDIRPRLIFSNGLPKAIINPYRNLRTVLTNWDMQANILLNCTDSIFKILLKHPLWIRRARRSFAFVQLTVFTLRLSYRRRKWKTDIFLTQQTAQTLFLICDTFKRHRPTAHHYLTRSAMRQKSHCYWCFQFCDDLINCIQTHLRSRPPHYSLSNCQHPFLLRTGPNILIDLSSESITWKESALTWLLRSPAHDTMSSIPTRLVFQDVCERSWRLKCQNTKCGIKESLLPSTCSPQPSRLMIALWAVATQSWAC